MNRIARVSRAFAGLSGRQLSSGPRAGRFQAAGKDVTQVASGEHATTAEDLEEFQLENKLDGTQTRDAIHTAFASRAMASVRYDYFAQRAELDVELDAAAAFRALTESAKQQAMGYLELMEEYGDADFGATLDNIAISAEGERVDAEEIYPKNGSVASEEQLEQVSEWFEDMAAASNRAAERFELVSATMEAEMMEEEEDEMDMPVPKGGLKD